MRLIDEIAYQEKIAKIPIEERTFVKAWETAQDMPTIDAVPVVRGRWEEMRNPYGGLEGWIHKKCGRTTKEASNYCPNCGAKMEVKQDER